MSLPSLQGLTLSLSRLLSTRLPSCSRLPWPLGSDMWGHPHRTPDTVPITTQEAVTVPPSCLLPQAGGSHCAWGTWPAPTAAVGAGSSLRSAERVAPGKLRTQVHCPSGPCPPRPLHSERGLCVSGHSELLIIVQCSLRLLQSPGT